MKRVRTPTVMQMEAVECGAAALGIVMGYYGRYIPLEELRVTCGVSRDGSTALNIVKAARTYGMVARGFRRDLETIAELEAPVIVYWNLEHFLVLEGVKNDTWYLNDPAQGPRTVSREQFSAAFSGIVVDLRPGPDFKRGGMRPTIWSSLRERRQGLSAALTFVVLASLLLVLPGMVSPALTRIFFDDYLGLGQQSWLQPVLIGLFAAAMANGLLTALQQSYLLRLQTRLALAGAARFFWHVLRLPMEFFSQRYGGELGWRVSLNDRVAQLLSGQLATAALNLLTVTFYGIIMLVLDLRLGLIAIAFALLNVGALRQVSRKRIDTNQRLLAEQAQLMGTAMGGLQMIETLKASGGEEDFYARWAGYQANMVDAQQELSVYTQYLTAVPPVLRMLGTAAILTVGGMRVMEGELSIGMLIAFQALAQSFAQPIDQLVGLGGSLQEAAADMARLDDVAHAPIDPELAGDQKSALGQLEGHVELRGVSFGYSRMDPPLIEDFSVVLRPGARVAVVGDTGSGKSTIAKLVAGLERPWSGEILLDGQPRESLPRAMIASSLAMVDEAVFLFSDTVRQNLTLWDDTIRDEDLDRAATDACVIEDILSRPGGFDAEVLEGGSNFSGGQRQRLEIARALARNPSVMVLDEATSALDALTEVRIDQNLRRRGCTCLVIAHRLSTIRDCDEIIVLENGKVLQRGTHESLLAAGGAYAKLLEAAVPRLVLPTSTVARPLEAQSDVVPKAPALVDGGTDVAGSALHPVNLRATRDIWQIAEGTADVFAIAKGGRRWFLTSVTAGDLVYGLGTETALDWVLLGLPNTRLRRAGEAPAAALDAWVTQLLAFITTTVRRRDAAAAPHTFTAVERPGSMTLEAHQQLRCSRGVLWVEVTAGVMAVCGSADLSLAPTQGWFPLGGQLHLDAGSGATVNVRDSGDLLGEATCETLLATVNAFVTRIMDEDIAAEQAAAVDRARQRVEEDDALFERAHRRLASVLSDASFAAQGYEAGDDAVMTACRLLEPTLGVKLQRPPHRYGRSALQEAAALARVSGVRARPVTLAKGWWRRASQPLIVLAAKDGHPMAVIPSGGGLRLTDPAADRVVTLSARTVRETPVRPQAIAFYRPLPRGAMSALDLVRFALRDSGRDLACAALCALGVAMLAAGIPLATARVFSSAIPSGLSFELWQIGVALCVAAISTGLLQMAGNIALLRLQTRMDVALQAGLWDRLMRLPASFFRLYSAGDLAVRALSISTVVTTLSGLPLQALLAGVFSICSFAVLLFLSPSLAALCALMAVISTALTVSWSVLLLRRTRLVADWQGRISGVVLQFITGIDKLRVAAAESRAFYVWSRLFAEQRRLGFLAGRVMMAMTTFQAMWPVLGTFGLFAIYGLREYKSLSTADFIAAYAAFLQVMAALAVLFGALPAALQALPMYERSRPILDAEPEVEEGRALPGELVGTLDLRNVSFRYHEDGPWTLENVSMHADPGEFVAIVGPSGAGKSTICRMLLGFDLPQRGTVAYDGKDINGLDTAALRHELGVVLQSGQLMRGTILQNIIGTSPLTIDDAWEAARLADIADDIRAMPMGMATYVSEGASMFSGGQKQRLLIARAIARRPRIVILDEATSGLDNASQEVVSKSLMHLRATRIVIAHRLSTIIDADRIYVVKDGRVVQTGRYDTLIAEEGTFRQLAQRQLL